MGMSEKRMGEIALAVLIAKMTAEGGVKIGPELRRNLGQISKDTDIPIEDLEEFSKELVVRFIGKAYRMQHVSLVMGEPYKK